ncbi:hypothetical protein Y032_0082g1527 [Ancylostoma ceylanicum]|nr:hypothetical protein Y032_0082g1527 [Ancylostoma ceylanicum]
MDGRSVEVRRSDDVFTIPCFITHDQFITPPPTPFSFSVMFAHDDVYYLREYKNSTESSDVEVRIGGE